jgi:hypothetical protein
MNLIVGHMDEGTRLLSERAKTYCLPSRIPPLGARNAPEWKMDKHAHRTKSFGSKTGIRKTNSGHHSLLRKAYRCQHNKDDNQRLLSISRKEDGAMSLLTVECNKTKMHVHLYSYVPTIQS